MQTNVVVILKKSKGFDEKLWTMAQLSDNKLAVEYELIHHLDVLRDRHETYLAKWTTMINEVRHCNCRHQSDTCHCRSRSRSDKASQCGTPSPKK